MYVDLGSLRDFERPTMGEELFELDADLVPEARAGGGLPSQPSGVLLSEQLPLSLLLVTAVLVCLRKPKLIFGIRLPNPPPPVDLFLSDIVALVALLWWRPRGVGTCNGGGRFLELETRG